MKIDKTLLLPMVLLLLGTPVCAQELNDTASEPTNSAAEKGDWFLDKFADQPISKFQAIGTHNSYHIQPGPVEREFIAMSGESRVLSLEYSHEPLPKQFESGIRSIELDLFQDPQGAKYATPAVFLLARAKGTGVPAPVLDPEGLMKKPGTKILHFADFDFRTTVFTLTKALQQIKAWSTANPKHFPIFVLLELKGDKSTWTDEAFRNLEKEILQTLPRKRILGPDDVRGKHPDLKTAILKTGWPTIKRARGHVILALDNTNEVLTAYLKPDPLVKGRLLFPSCPNDQHPSAAWFKINDPVANFDRIQRLTSVGFLVRTRADANTQEARKNDTSRREKAFSSGAQFISTDFPVANPKFSNYAARFDEHPNPFLRTPGRSLNRQVED